MNTDINKDGNIKAYKIYYIDFATKILVQIKTMLCVYITKIGFLLHEARKLLEKCYGLKFGALNSNVHDWTLKW